MATPIVIPAIRLLFPYTKWSSRLSTLRRQFRENQPYPHVHLKEFLDVDVAAEIAGEFPDMATDAWTRYKHPNENKLGLAKRSLFPPLLGEIRAIKYVLAPFVNFHDGSPDRCDER